MNNKLPSFLRGGMALAAVLSAMSIAACGGSSGSDATAAGANGSGASSNDRDTARLKLQQCLRDQGIDIPEPGQGGGPGGGRPNLSESDREKLQEAFAGPCKQYQQNAFGNISEEDRQEMQDRFQEFASCMRDHGVDLPDIRPGQGGPPAGGRGIDMDDPDVQEAQEQCRDNLPQGGPGGGPGGSSRGDGGHAG